MGLGTTKNPVTSSVTRFFRARLRGPKGCLYLVGFFLAVGEILLLGFLPGSDGIFDVSEGAEGDLLPVDHDICPVLSVARLSDASYTGRAVSVPLAAEAGVFDCEIRLTKFVPQFSSPFHRGFDFLLSALIFLAAAGKTLARHQPIYGDFPFLAADAAADEAITVLLEDGPIANFIAGMDAVVAGAA